MDEPPLLYRPGNMTRLVDGTLVVGDVGEWRVVVIDAETDSVVDRFGRVGSGPVEDSPIPADHAVWRLLRVSGRYAGAIHFPERFGPRWIGDGYVLGVTRDSLDVATIEEFALEPPDAIQY